MRKTFQAGIWRRAYWRLLGNVQRTKRSVVDSVDNVEIALATRWEEE
jgi:hypothetical protein